MTFSKIIATAIFSTVLSVSATAADLDQPTTADPAVRLELDGGYTYFGAGGVSIDGVVIGGGGSVSLPVGPLAAQVDALLKYEDYNGGNGGNLTNFSGGLHLGWRDAEKGLFGLSGKYGNINPSGGGGSIDYLRAGLEAEYFLDAITVGAHAGYVGILNAGGSDGFYGKLAGKFYAQDNFRLDASVGLLEMDSNGIDAVYASAGAEYKFNDLPISLTAKWNGNFFSNGGIGSKPKGHQILAGVRIYFGGNGNGTIKSYDRSNFAESCTMGGAFFSFC